MFGPGITQLTDNPSTDKFTQELRLSTGIGTFVDLTVGAFYTNEKSNRDSEIIYRDPGSGAVIPDLFILSTPSKRSEEHTSELQSLMRISYAVFCLKKKNT